MTEVLSKVVLQAKCSDWNGFAKGSYVGLLFLNTDGNIVLSLILKYQVYLILSVVFPTGDTKCVSDRSL